MVESRQEGRTVVTIGIDTHKATLAVHYVFGSMPLKLQAASRVKPSRSDRGLFVTDASRQRW